VVAAARGVGCVRGGGSVAVLVTGGTGFVGSHVAARLVAQGHAVRLFVRDPAKLARVPALRDARAIEVVVGDVTDRESVDRALDDCTAVVHAAAHVSLAERDTLRSEAVNVGGTQLVVGAAAERVMPSVYVSSVAVFGHGQARITIDTPLTDARGTYARSKVAAERVVRELQSRGAPIAIVYPSGVLGPDAVDMSATHQGLAGWVRTPPRMPSGTSIVDVRDVAVAIERALVAAPARWMLGGTFLAWDQVHAAIERVTGVPRRAVMMPAPVLRLAGRVGDIVKRVVPFEYPLTYEAMVMATQACPYDSDATCLELDLQWRPVDDTLADSIRWLAATGHLPSRLAGSLAP
jgi:nucleoside-diphosphate-sugar epimerase